MAKLSSGAVDKTMEDLETKLTPVVASLSVTTQPVVICGVQRKINTGNYENIDVYAAVAMPVTLSDDPDETIELIRETIDEVFRIASEETYERYKIIKDTTRG
jgi:hypothetical protein